MLGFVPQTPLASPVGDAARSLLPRRGTSRGTRPTQWLPNLHSLKFLGLTELYWSLISHFEEAFPK